MLKPNAEVFRGVSIKDVDPKYKPALDMCTDPDGYTDYLDEERILYMVESYEEDEEKLLPHEKDAVKNCRELLTSMVQHDISRIYYLEAQDQY